MFSMFSLYTFRPFLIYAYNFYQRLFLFPSRDYLERSEWIARDFGRRQLGTRRGRLDFEEGPEPSEKKCWISYEFWRDWAPTWFLLLFVLDSYHCHTTTLSWTFSAVTKHYKIVIIVWYRELVIYCVGMSLFSSFFVLLLVLVEASPTSASVSNLGKHTLSV